MGTRSRIGLETANGAVYSVYCHWDGYPSHNGRILVDHYSDETKLRELIDLGNISSLAPEIAGAPGHSFDSRVKGQTVFYGRDRGEAEQEAEIDDSREAFFARAADGWEEYVYLWTQGEWLVSGVGGGAGPFLGRADVPPEWALLVDVLAGETAPY